MSSPFKMTPKSGVMKAWKSTPIKQGLIFRDPDSPSKGKKAPKPPTPKINPKPKAKALPKDVDAGKSSKPMQKGGWKKGSEATERISKRKLGGKRPPLKQTTQKKETAGKKNDGLYYYRKAKASGEARKKAIQTGTIEQTPSRKRVRELQGLKNKKASKAAKAQLRATSAKHYAHSSSDKFERGKRMQKADKLQKKANRKYKKVTGKEVEETPVKQVFAPSKAQTKGKEKKVDRSLFTKNDKGETIAKRGQVNVAPGVKMQIKGRSERNYNLANAPRDIAKGIKKGYKKVKSYFN